ncbi:MAG: SDR family oxidoreductase [Armatimonadetes bacterium]|nr:SDR family oxidoreductase [Armatimonadota bacterium]
MNDSFFSNKVIIITGASEGIGFSVAKHLSSLNAQLILLSRNESKLKVSVSKLDNRRHKYFSVDVGEAQEVKNLFIKLQKKNTAIYGLINCAGIFGGIGRLDTVPPEVFFKAIKTNLLGTYNMCNFGLSLLKKSTHSKIINFSGGGAASLFPNYTGYACSKIAVVKLTENIAEEYKNENIDVNVIAPGFIKTNLANQTLKAGKSGAGNFYQKTLDMLNCEGIPVEHTLNLVEFLLSERSNGITGKFISAPWDDWDDLTFQQKLRTDKDFCTLRRIDDKYFQSKN